MMQDAYLKNAGYNTKGPGTAFHSLALHCGTLVQMFTAAAERFAMLAKEHRTLATMAK